MIGVLTYLQARNLLPVASICAVGFNFCWTVDASVYSFTVGTHCVCLCQSWLRTEWYRRAASVGKKYLSQADWPAGLQACITVAVLTRHSSAVSWFWAVWAVHSWNAGSLGSVYGRYQHLLCVCYLHQCELFKVQYNVTVCLFLSYLGVKLLSSLNIKHSIQSSPLQTTNRLEETRWTTENHLAENNMRMFSLRTLGSIQHGGRQEIGIVILGNKSSVRQRSATSWQPRRRRRTQYL